MTDAFSLIGAWIITYALHSSVILAATWLILRRTSALALRAEECVWKLALLGGLVTASLQVAGSVEPWGGTWRPFSATPVADFHGTDAGTPQPVPATAPARQGDGPGRVPLEADVAALRGAAHHGVASNAPAHTAASVPVNELADSVDNTENAGAESMPLGQTLLGGLGTLGAGFGFCGLLVLAWSWARLTRRFGSRRLLPPSSLTRQVEMWARRAGLRRVPRLTVSESVGCPVAFGVLRPEICLPARALTELSPLTLEAVVAHEIAHHRAHDPAWRLLGYTLEVLFPFQIFHRVANARLRELAEYRCDALAVELTGNPRGFAEGLAQVAAWLFDRRGTGPRSSLAPAMAVGPSALRRRVSRILSPRHTHRRRQWIPASVAGLCLGAALGVLPGVSAAPVPALEAPVLDSGSVATPPTSESEVVLLMAALRSELSALSTEVTELRNELKNERREIRDTPDDDPDLNNLEQHRQRLEQRGHRLEQAVLRALATLPGPEESKAPPSRTRSPRKRDRR